MSWHIRQNIKSLSAERVALLVRRYYTLWSTVINSSAVNVKLKSSRQAQVFVPKVVGKTVEPKALTSRK